MTTLDQARAFHQAGKLDEAEALYLEALREKPGDPNVLRPLGILETQNGKHAAALSRFERVLSRHPDDHEVRYYRGVCLQALGRHDQAVACYDRVLEAVPDLFEALNNRGLGLQALGRLKEALASFDAALALRPDVDVVLNRAGALHALGRHEHALAGYERALALRADDADALVGRGNALHALARHEEAVASYDRALALDAGYAEAWSNRAAVLRALGRNEDALASYDRALAARPELHEAALGRGALLRALRRDEEALASYDLALAARPDDPRILLIRAGQLHAMGRQTDALETCARAVASDPENAAARWALAMWQIPAVYRSEAEPDAARAAFAAKLRELDRWFGEGRRLDGGAECVGAQQPFHLAYQERNNRELLLEYGTLCTRIMQRWLSRRGGAEVRADPAPRKIRVGVVSPWFYDQSVWTAIVKGWFRKMDRERFALLAFHLGAVRDGETEFARSAADHFEQGEHPWAWWADAILRQRPDVIIYPEVGMDRTTVKLASLRLAPVQMAAWGHPESSGLPTIDGFLSAALLEPDDAQQNYTERLVRLPNLGCHYAPLAVARRKPDLAGLGIEHGPLLICPGMALKYDPRYDGIFPAIARRVGRCTFVFFANLTRGPSDVLARRLREAFDRAGMRFDEFVRFVPWQPRDSFYGLLESADVYLDTIGFSGFNTAMQAIECGLPIVTREGRFLRGRLASGILKRLGLDPLVAASEERYVELAARLALDEQYRARIRTHIEANRSVLFQDESAVRALENALIEAVPSS